MASFRSQTARLRASIRIATVALIFAGCDSASGPDEPRVASVRIAPSNPVLTVGETRQLTATALNAQGGTIADKTATWTSSSPLIVEVNGAGQVRAAGIGSAQITATIDNVVGRTTVTVNPPPVASVNVTGPANSVDVGATLQLTATPRDASGTALAGRQITWTSSQAGIATVSATGLVQGVAPGQAEIRATSENVTGTFALTVTTSGPALTITEVTPGSMLEGGVVTLTGSGFAATTNANVVTVGGALATVTAVTSTSLSFTVPTGTCLPSGPAVVRVVANGASSAQVNHPFQSPRTPLSVAIGEQAMIRNPAEFCLQFGANAAAEQYVFGITSVSEVAGALTPVQVTGLIPAAAAASSGYVLNSAMVRTVGGANPVAAIDQRWLRHRAAELELRRQERAELERFPRTALRSAYSANSLSRIPSVPATVRVGDTVTVKVPNIRAGSCNTFASVRSVVRTIGTRGIWVEDVGNPAGGFTTADFDSASAAFDNRIYPTNVEYFGQPSDLDQNGRIVIVTTKEVNRMGGIVGFVTTVDLGVPASCSSSNEGEYYYGAAPDPTGQYSLGEFSLATARNSLPTLIAHEFAHVIQFTRRLANPGATSFQSQWEAEGQATFAEEINGHAATGNSVGQNYGFSVAFNEPATSNIDWYIGSFVDLALYYGFASQTNNVGNAPEQCGWLSSTAQAPCVGGRNVYGVAWSFLRWLSDQYGPTYPGGEKALHRALIDNNFVGFRTISNVIGEDIDVLLTRWAAALHLDDKVAGLAPHLRFTSWNLADIESRLVQTARLNPRTRTYSSFADEVAVRSGSTAYFRIGGANRPNTGVRVTSPGGGPLPASMRLWVVRVQ